MVTGAQLIRTKEIEPRLRSLMVETAEAFSDVCLVGSTKAIQSGSQLLDACQALTERATTGQFDNESVEAARSILATKRVDFLKVARADLRIKGDIPLPAKDSQESPRQAPFDKP